VASARTELEENSEAEIGELVNDFAEFITFTTVQEEELADEHTDQFPAPLSANAFSDLAAEIADEQADQLAELRSHSPSEQLTAETVHEQTARLAELSTPESSIQVGSVDDQQEQAADLTSAEIVMDADKASAMHEASTTIEQAEAGTEAIAVLPIYGSEESQKSWKTISMDMGHMWKLTKKFIPVAKAHFADSKAESESSESAESADVEPESCDHSRSNSKESFPGICPPMPELRRLCGKCPPQLANETFTLFPNRALHVDFRRHLKRINPVLDPKPLPHWASDVDDIQLPPLPEPSSFSRNPHPTVPLLTGFEVFHLETKLHQAKVRWPVMKEVVQSWPSDMFKSKANTYREALETSTLRCALLKNAPARSFKERFFIREYLKRRPFFKNLPPKIMHDISANLIFKRFDKDEVIYKHGNEVDNIYFILDGTTNLKDDPPYENASMSKLRGAVKDLLPVMPIRSITKVVKVVEAKRVANKSRFYSLSAEELEAQQRPWRGAAGLGLNPGVQVNSIKDANVIGLWDLLVPYASPPRALETGTVDRHLRYTMTAVATDTVQAMALSASALVGTLDEQSKMERITLLQTLFPLTKDLSYGDLLEDSRVARDGKSVALQELFTVSDIRRNTTLWMQNEIPNLSDAKIIMMVDGSVELKDRGQVLATIEAGALIGESALKGMSKYPHTAFVKSSRARIMYISIADFTTHFLPGREHGAKQDIDPLVLDGFFKCLDEPRPKKKTNFGAILLKGEPAKLALTSKLDVSAMLKLHATEKEVARSKTVYNPVEEQEDSSPDDSSDVERVHFDVTNLRKLNPDSKTEDKMMLMKTDWHRVSTKRMPPRLAPPGCQNLHRTTEDLTDEWVHARNRNRQNRHAQTMSSRMAPPVGHVFNLTIEKLTEDAGSWNADGQCWLARSLQPTKPFGEQALRSTWHGGANSEMSLSSTAMLAGALRAPSGFFQSLRTAPLRGADREQSGSPSPSRSPSPDRKPWGTDSTTHGCTSQGFEFGHVTSSALSSYSPRTTISKLGASSTAGGGWRRRTESPDPISAMRFNLELPVELSGSNVNFVGERMTKAFKRHREHQELFQAQRGLPAQQDGSRKSEEDLKSKALLARRQRKVERRQRR